MSRLQEVAEQARDLPALIARAKADLRPFHGKRVRVLTTSGMSGTGIFTGEYFDDGNVTERVKITDAQTSTYILTRSDDAWCPCLHAIKSVECIEPTPKVVL